MTEIAWGPSNAGSVILDLGADIGALILDTPAELAGREIEISPASAGRGARRTRARGRGGRAGAGTGCAAVSPGLPAAEYTVWKDAVTPVATVTVCGGQVARCHWPG